MADDNNVQIQISVKGVDQVGRDLNKAKTQFDNFGKQMNQGSLIQGVAIGTVLGNAITGAFSTAMGAVQSIANTAITGVIDAVNKASDLQQTGVAIKALLGNAEDAKKLLQDLQTFAETTPFDLTNLTDLSKQLLAAGFAADEIIPTIEALGDISSAVGTEHLGGLVYALGQTRVALQFAGNDLLQFRNAGVNVETIFKNKFNKTVQQVNDSIKNGSMAYKEAEDAILSLGRTGGKFDGLMIEQSRTFKGLISNLEDVRDKFLGLVGGYNLAENTVVEGGLLDTLSKSVKQLLDTLNTPEMQSKLAQIGTQLSQTFGTFVTETIPKIIEQLPQLIEDAGKFISSINPDQIKDRVKEFITTLGTIKDVLEFIFNVARFGLDNMKLGFELVGMSIETTFNNISIALAFVRGDFVEIQRLQNRNVDLQSRMNDNIKQSQKDFDSLKQVIDRTSGSISVTNEKLIAVRDTIASINTIGGQAGSGLLAGVVERHASGGIVGGNSRSGDRIPIMANSGEMILNGGQQNALMNLLTQLASRPQQVITANFNSNGNRSDRQESNLFLQTLQNI